jgi:hypothetical protein
MTIIRNFANTVSYISANGQYTSANLSGTVAVSQITGLANVATSGSANDITTGTLPSSVYTVGASGNQITTIYTSPAPWTKPATLKSVKVTLVSGGGGGGGGTGAGQGALPGGSGGNGGILLAQLVLLVLVHYLL